MPQICQSEVLLAVIFKVLNIPATCFCEMMMGK